MWFAISFYFIMVWACLGGFLVWKSLSHRLSNLIMVWMPLQTWLTFTVFSTERIIQSKQLIHMGLCKARHPRLQILKDIVQKQFEVWFAMRRMHSNIIHAAVTTCRRSWFGPYRICYVRCMVSSGERWRERRMLVGFKLYDTCRYLMLVNKYAYACIWLYTWRRCKTLIWSPTTS